MTETKRKGMSGEDNQGATPAWLTKTALAGLLAIGIAYGWLRLSFGPTTLEQHGQLGDALAPMAELLMLAALLAALYSAHLQRVELGLQRKELALQRQEMKDARAEMVQQRKQLERSAAAQEELAASQRELAKTQFEQMQRSTPVQEALAKAQSDLAEAQRDANELAVWHSLFNARANIDEGTFDRARRKLVERADALAKGHE